MKKLFYLFFLIFINFLFDSCTTELNQKIKVRVILKSEVNRDVEFKIYLENDFGQIINGAFVMVESQTGEVSILGFNNDNQCYSGTINGVEKDIYTIKIKSNCIDKIYTLEVPHERLLTKPIIKSFSDSNNNNVLKGDELKKENRIQIAWDFLGDAVSYQVIIRNAANVKWMMSTPNCSVVIPSNTLDSGTYYCSINAQKSFGDLRFEDMNYYSVSNISSSLVYFCVE